MTNSTPYPRRRFLKTIAGAALLLYPAGALSFERPRRKQPRIKGVGLTTFSLRPLMRYWRGEAGEGEMDILDFLDYCAETGVDTAELTSYFFDKPVEREFLHEVRRRAHLFGIDLAGGAIGNNFTHPPGSDEARKQLEYTSTWIDHFAELGIPVIRVFAGVPPKKMPVDEAIQNVVANLKEAVAYAERRGVILGVENHDLTTNVDYLLRIVQKVDSKWCGITFDSANLSRTSDPYADLARIAPYAVSAQLKVMIPVDGKKQQADFGRIISILKEAGYSGYVILEYEEDGDPLTEVPRYLDQIRAAVEQSMPATE